MAKQSVEITGVWVHKQFAHLGGELEVRVEIAGQWHIVQTHSQSALGDGCISHITEPSGMLNSQVWSDNVR